MSISFACTKCGKRYSVKDEFAGKKVKCAACGTSMTLPKLGEKPAVPAAQKSESKTAAKKPDANSGAKSSGDEYELDSAPAPIKRAETPTMAGHILQPKVDPDQIDDFELEPPPETKIDVGVFLDEDASAAKPSPAGNKPSKSKPAPAASSLDADDLTVAEDPEDEPPPPEPTMACPECGEQIKQSSVLCIHCGLNLKTGEKIAGASKKGAFGKLFGGRKKS